LIRIKFHVLPYQLASTAAQVSRELAGLYSTQFGISIPEWRVLAHLAQGQAVSVREIHLRVDMDKPKVSRSAARLEKAGYVGKSVNSGDKRLVELTLTPKGEKLFAELEPIALEYEAKLLERLGATNKKLFLSLLNNLSETDS